MLSFSSGDLSPHLKHGTKMSQLFLRVSIGEQPFQTFFGEIACENGRHGSFLGYYSRICCSLEVRRQAISLDVFE
jgi:hypothetical protein